MIRLSKQPEPQWLTDNKATKTLEYISAPAGNKPNPWRNKNVVSALRAETHGKCMYCETIIEDDGYPAVEHIKPKVQFSNEVLEWKNLGFACNRCNTDKGEYWSDSDDLRLLNPYVDLVEKHIEFSGPMTIPALTSTRGENTVRQLKLTNRGELLISRFRRIEQLEARLRLWANETDLEKQALYAEDVIDALSDDREYSGVLRAYAVTRGFAVPTKAS